MFFTWQVCVPGIALLGSTVRGVNGLVVGLP